MEPRPRNVEFYVAPNGDCPFREFLIGLHKQPAYGLVTTRLARIRVGAFGDSKPIGAGVSEVRIHQGPGYRLYFGIDGDNVMMLCGGKKDRQTKDIARAKALWSDYCEKKD